jgi:hypothetical protein
MFFSLAIATAATFAQAQWQLHVQGGFVGAGGSIEPASSRLEHSMRSGVSLGGELEYRFHPQWSLSTEVAFREHGVQRYHRELLMEDHRYGCLDAALLLRWMPLPGTLRPYLVAGCGLTTPLSATIQFGFHDRYNSIVGPEALRSTIPHVRLGAGCSLDFSSGVTLRSEAAWQTALSDMYSPSVSGARAFFISDLLILLSIGVPLS